MSHGPNKAWGSALSGQRETFPLGFSQEFFPIGILPWEKIPNY